MNARAIAESRVGFVHFHEIATRWMDNDSYGHVNNVVYYSYFDTAVNYYLIKQGLLDFRQSDVIGLVVETKCCYFRAVAFPDTIYVGVRVANIGTSSVRYELGIFSNDDEIAAAQGHFVHVYVNRETNRPVPLPVSYREALMLLSRDT
ncbi:MAG: thioesterase family protein [Herbaspirillum sp.]